MSADEQKSAEYGARAIALRKVAAGADGPRTGTRNELRNGFSSTELPIPISGRIARALLDHIRNDPGLQQDFVRRCMRNVRLRERILKWAEERRESPAGF